MMSIICPQFVHNLSTVFPQFVHSFSIICPWQQYHVFLLLSYVHDIRNVYSVHSVHALSTMSTMSTVSTTSTMSTPCPRCPPSPSPPPSPPHPPRWQSEPWRTDHQPRSLFLFILGTIKKEEKKLWCFQNVTIRAHNNSQCPVIVCLLYKLFFKNKLC